MLGGYALVLYSNAYGYDAQMDAGYSFFFGVLPCLVLFNFWPVIMDIANIILKQIYKLIALVMKAKEKRRITLIERELL